MEQKKSSELIDSIRAEHKKNISLKRGLIAMACFAVLLAVANIGTSFVAVSLVKDTKVGNTNDLMTMDGQRVSTTTKVTEFSFDAPASSATDQERRRRHLAAMQQVACSGIGANSSCNLIGLFNFQKSKRIYQELCDDWVPNWTPNYTGSTCTGGGAENVMLNCNGVRTTIKGGNYLPAKGPSIVDDGVWPYWAFPSADDFYTTEERVYPEGVPHTYANSCLLTYDLSVICPTDNSECAAFGIYDLTECPDMDPLICNFDTA